MGLIRILTISNLLFLIQARRLDKSSLQAMVPDVLLQQDNPYMLDSIETTTYDSYTSGNTSVSNSTEYTSNSTDIDQSYDEISHKNGIKVEDEEYEDYDEILHAYYSGEMFEGMVGVTAESDDEQISLPRAYPNSGNYSDESVRVVSREGDASESKGDDGIDGDLQFVLVTSFLEGMEGTGKVWAISKDAPDDAHVIIAGLEKPTGICFDNNNNFLYVADPGFLNKGYIYQYEILWNDDEEFVLKIDDYVVIIEDAAAYDCAVDEYGNLFFVDYLDNEINVVNYADLWAGTKNQEYSIYARTEISIPISYPVAIDVIHSTELWYVNNLNCDAYGLLNSAQADTDYLNEESIDSKVHSKYRGWGVAVGKSKLAYFSMSSGEVYAFDTVDEEKNYLKSKEFFGDPRGICYGEDKVFVADYERGVVYIMGDNEDEETPEGYVRIEGAYNVFCVNSSQHLILSLAILVIILIF